MSLTANPYQSYRQTHVETADPATLVMMMYNGALKFLRQGRAALEQGDLEEANRLLGRTQDILSEMIGSLNPDAGDVTVNLFSLYEYSHYQITQAIISKEAKPLSDAEQILLILQEGWRGMMPQVKVAAGEELR